MDPAFRRCGVGKKSRSTTPGGEAGHAGGDIASAAGSCGQGDRPVGQELNLVGARSVESEWWREMKESLPTDCRLLQLNPLYALPRELLDALDKHVGGILDEDREGEHQLAAFCKENDLDGFWYRKPFNYPQLRPHHEDLLDDEHLHGYEGQWPLSKSEVKERCANVLAPAVITRNRMHYKQNHA